MRGLLSFLRLTERDEKKREKEREQKKRDTLGYSILRCGDISRLISDFSGIVSELPLAIIGKRRVRKIPLSTGFYSISAILSLPWESYFEYQCILGSASQFLSEIKEANSLAFSAWYATQRIKLGVDEEETYNVPCGGSPWSEEVSLADAEWYFHSKDGGSFTFFSLLDIERDSKFYNARQGKDRLLIGGDEIWLLHYYNLIPLDEVPIRYQNVLNFALRDRWTTVENLIERGDLDRISPHHLFMLPAHAIDRVLSLARSMWKTPFYDWKGRFGMATNLSSIDIEKVANILRHYMVLCTPLVYKEVIMHHWRLLPKPRIREILGAILECEFSDSVEIFNAFKEPISHHYRPGIRPYPPIINGLDVIIDHISSGQDLEAVQLICRIISGNCHEKSVRELKIECATQRERTRELEGELARMKGDVREYERRIVDLCERLSKLEKTIPTDKK